MSLSTGMGHSFFPPKFKQLILNMYDDKSSPNQHIYYIRSQTGNVIDNDIVKARLFIDTLKSVVGVTDRQYCIFIVTFSYYLFNKLCYLIFFLSNYLQDLY